MVCLVRLAVGLPLLAFLLSGCIVEYRKSETPDLFWAIVERGSGANVPWATQERLGTIRARQDIIAGDVETLLNSRLPSSLRDFEAFLINNGFQCYYTELSTRDVCFYQRSLVVHPIYPGAVPNFDQALIKVAVDHANGSVGSIRSKVHYGLWHPPSGPTRPFSPGTWRFGGF